MVWNQGQFPELGRFAWRLAIQTIAFLRFVGTIAKIATVCDRGPSPFRLGLFQRPHSEMQAQMTKTHFRKPDTQPGKRTTPTTSKKKQPLTQEEKNVLTKVDENITEIREAHRIGLSLNKVSPGHSRPYVMRELAKQHDIPVGVARRYRQFAMTFTAAELNKLYEAFRANKYALKITHFVVLLDVVDKTVRQKLALDAVHQNLSVSGLRKLKTKTINREKAAGGRKPDVLKSPDKATLYQDVQYQMAKWHNWLNLVIKDDLHIKVSLKNSLQELRAQVQKVQKLSRS